MDTITHAFAGALLGKGIFATQRLDPAAESADEYGAPASVAIFAVTLGSAFPDADVFYDWVSRDSLAMLKYHRYVTHSILCLPLWALALAWLTRWGARRLGIRAPSFGWLWLCYAVGIGSHILLDLATSFGTIIRSPLSRVRPAWDLIFIVDFTMSALLLLPQVASWTLRVPQRGMRRALRMWALFSLLAVGAAWLAAEVGFPFSHWYILIAIGLMAALFFVPLRGNRGVAIRRSTWARVGILAASTYLCACAITHHIALRRVQAFALQRQVQPLVIAALPLPPSIWRWDGLIRTGDGDYRIRENLLGPAASEFHFYADSAPGNMIVAAEQLQEARTYLWFARFPLYTLAKYGGQTALEIMDLRFFTRQRHRTPGFTFRVTFDAAGHVTSQGMVRDTR